MRLGIRRKLIGTLMLVGLLPLAMSLIVILGGGAVMQLSRIRTSYEENAKNCAKTISTEIFDIELDRLAFVAHGPRFLAFVRQHNTGAATASLPTASAEDRRIEQGWAGLKITDEPLSGILDNEVSQRLRDLTANDNLPRQLLMTNARGELIAADVKSANYFQAGEGWWQSAYNQGKGRLYISSIVMNPTDGQPIVEIAFPIYDTVGGQQVIAGIIKDKMSVQWLFAALLSETAESHAQSQLVDLDAGKTIYAPAAILPENRAEHFAIQHADHPHVPVLTLLYNNIVIGAAPVTFQGKVLERFDEVALPRWMVVVSKPSQEAMTPVYTLAMWVAGSGIGLILVLFILGVAISNREIIMPILRLREATAAVGRGELNVRLLSADASDKAFRKDELGELARDFDEMTRQLQKNLNQLARSNEAKRRFMELAGHELRTPVTYLIGVCQLAQRQIQQLASATADGPDNQASVALTQRNAVATQAAIAKISAKTQRLSRIIDNLLKLVNNDQFTTRLVKESVDIRALLLQVTSDQRPFITERKQQLTLDLAENLPSIEADRDKLEDALSNLVSNAIRFSPDGGTVRIASHEVVGDMLEILVEDSGPGIPPADVANLFEPFYTGSDILHHQSGTFEYGTKGIGLGLAIVRRFIELHGGIVRAHTIVREGKTVGTQFQILLPLDREGAGEVAAG